MADLAANLPENLRNIVSDVAAGMGIQGELGAEQVVEFLNKLNVALSVPDQAFISFSDGAQITLEDFTDPEKRGIFLDSLATSLNSLRESDLFAAASNMLVEQFGDQAPQLFDNIPVLIQAVRDFNSSSPIASQDVVAEAAEQPATRVVRPDSIYASSDVANDVGIVEAGLAMLIPAVQGRLDERRADAENMINQIEGHESWFADFYDGFILGTLPDSTFGHRIADTGKEWAVDAIRSGFSGIYDIPDSFRQDGVLDAGDQAAMQGALFLLATNFNIHLDNKWQYRPELGRLLLEKIDTASFEDQESIVLNLLEQTAAGDGPKAAEARRDLEAYQAMEQAQRVTFIRNKMEESKDYITLFISALNRLHEAGILIDERLYHGREISVSDTAQEIFTGYLGTEDSQIPVEQAALVNSFVYQFTGGIGMLDFMEEMPDVFAGMTRYDPSQDVSANFKEFYRQAFDSVGAVSAADFEEKFNPDYVSDMIESLPFGSSERREAFAQAMRNAFAAARKAEAQNTNDAENLAILLSNAFGDSMQRSMEAIEANPAMHSEYLWGMHKPVTLHPDLAEQTFTVEGGQTLTAQDIFDRYKSHNQHFRQLSFDGSEPRPLPSIDHQPLYFRGEDGQVYIAMIHSDSYVLDIQPLNLDQLEAAMADGYPGHTQLMDEYRRLVEISPGLGLAFQEDGPNSLWSVGTSKSMWEFTDQVQSHIRNLSESAQPDDEPAVEAEDAGVRGRFGEAAVGDVDAEPVAEDSGPEPDFRDTRDEIMRPAEEGLPSGTYPDAIIRQGLGGQ